MYRYRINMWSNKVNVTLRNHNGCTKFLEEWASVLCGMIIVTCSVCYYVIRIGKRKLARDIKILNDMGMELQEISIPRPAPIEYVPEASPSILPEGWEEGMNPEGR